VHRPAGKEDLPGAPSPQELEPRDDAIRRDVLSSTSPLITTTASYTPGREVSRADASRRLLSRFATRPVEKA